LKVKPSSNSPYAVEFIIGNFNLIIGQSPASNYWCGSFGCVSTNLWRTVNTDTYFIEDEGISWNSRNKYVATFEDVYLAVLIGRTVTPPTSFNRSPDIHSSICESEPESNLIITSGTSGISISVVNDGSYASVGKIKSYLKV
jgi:hypothetical protein